MKKPLTKLLVVVGSILFAVLNDASRELVVKRVHEGNLIIISIVLKFVHTTGTDPSLPLEDGRGK